MGERGMAAVPTNALQRFRSTVPHYRAGRPAYAPRLIHRVARLSGLSAPGRVLDLGCGPGLLAAAFAPFASEVMAMDPEPAMLAAVAELGLPNIRSVRGSSFDLSSALGRFRLVVMGRSFHWMDRADTLRRLDSLLEPGGPVVLFNTAHPELPANAWLTEFRGLRRRYAGDEDEELPNRSPGWVPHEGVLLDSPFNRIEGVSVIDRRQTPLASLLDRALSMSGTSPERLGDSVRLLAREIDTLLSPYATDGVLSEVVESQARLAFRPGEEPE